MSGVVPIIGKEVRINTKNILSKYCKIYATPRSVGLGPVVWAPSVTKRNKTIRKERRTGGLRVRKVKTVILWGEEIALGSGRGSVKGLLNTK